MNKHLGEKIAVLAVFKNGKLYPLSFLWNGKRYKIERINYTWQKRDGINSYYYFAVCSSSNIYELCFHREGLNWYLTHVHLGA
jgi:hypothetical protein